MPYGAIIYSLLILSMKIWAKRLDIVEILKFWNIY